MARAPRCLQLPAAVVAMMAASAAGEAVLPTGRIVVSLPFDGNSNATADASSFFRFDGVGGLSGGGATSTFLLAYPAAARAAMMDWLFLPDFAASLDILKVEVGADDQTTDGCEACHMRTPDAADVNCTRGYEWSLMKEAAARNPDITLYGLPWGFPGWLGFGTANPYNNVTATADYMARWVECARDAHGLNVSVMGLWNEAWQADGRPEDEPWAYARALRARLDAGGLGHVRIIAPDGDIADIVPDLQANASCVRTWKKKKEGDERARARACVSCARIG
jgi:galactosylceramidase